MLMRIDAILNTIPSRAINKVTGGKKHSSLCARLYLYRKYISANNKACNALISTIDSLEENHCEMSAKQWRIAHKKYGCYFPKRYKAWLKQG